jgi:hypothetical protein
MGVVPKHLSSAATSSCRGRQHCRRKQHQRHGPEHEVWQDGSSAQASQQCRNEQLALAQRHRSKQHQQRSPKHEAWRMGVAPKHLSISVVEEQQVGDDGERLLQDSG